MDPLGDLPMVARLTVRLLADGHVLEDVGRVMRLGPVAIERALRSALRLRGLPSPTRSLGLAELLRAAEPLCREAARAEGQPATACPPHDVIGAAWRGELDGPLLLATAEHLADCGPCRRLAPTPVPKADSTGAERSGCLSVLLAVACLAGGVLVAGLWWGDLGQ